jgi:FeS assembly SUF system protein
MLALGGGAETAPVDATAVTMPVAAWAPPALSAVSDEVSSPLHDEVIARIQTVFDPEIPVNIYELGLIYGVTIDEGAVRVEMTLTSPNCPSAQSLPDEVRTKIADLEGVATVDVEVVWDPPWGPERMSEEARLELNLG